MYICHCSGEGVNEDLAGNRGGLSGKYAGGAGPDGGGGGWSHEEEGQGGSERRKRYYTRFFNDTYQKYNFKKLYIRIMS